MGSGFFGNHIVTPQATRLGKHVITISGGDQLVCHGASFDFQRPAGVISPLNLDRKIVSSGEPQGGITLSVVLGASKGLARFLMDYSDDCQIGSNTITLTPADDCSGEQTVMTFYGLYLTRIQGSVQRSREGTLVIPQLQFIFIDMTYGDSSGQTGSGGSIGFFGGNMRDALSGKLKGAALDLAGAGLKGVVAGASPGFVAAGEAIGGGAGHIAAGVGGHVGGALGGIGNVIGGQ